MKAKTLSFTDFKMH